MAGQVRPYRVPVVSRTMHVMGLRSVACICQAEPRRQ